MAQTKQKSIVKPSRPRKGDKENSENRAKSVKRNEVDLEKMLYFMLLHRETEARIIELKKQGRIAGGVFSARGSEAVCVGGALALDKDDILVPGYGDLGAHLVRGATLREVFCQFLGKKNGPTKGRDSGLHMGSQAKGIVGLTGASTAMIPVAAGAALAGKLQGKDNCVMAFIDGAGTCAGEFHESLNAAAALGLPLVLIVKTIKYTGKVTTSLSGKSVSPVDYAAGYGIACISVDGSDVEEMYKASSKAVLDAKSGGAPQLILAAIPSGPEIVKSNVSEDSGKKTNGAQRIDPIEKLTGYVKAQKIITPASLTKLHDKVMEEIDEAVQFAEKSPIPNIADYDVSDGTITGIYAE